MGLHQLQMVLLVPGTSLLHFSWLKKVFVLQNKTFSTRISTAIYRYVFIWWSLIQLVLIAASVKYKAHFHHYYRLYHLISATSFLN